MAAEPVPRKRTDGTVVWRLPFRLRPGGVVTYETFTARDEAVKFGRLVDQVGGAAAREVRNASGRAAAEIPTLAAWVETHLGALGASATPGTVAEYRRMAARTWLPRLGSIPLDAISRDNVTAWVAWQRKQTTRRGVPYSTKSIANAQRFLSSIMAAAVEADLIVKNPAKGIPLPRDGAPHEMVYLTDNEVARLVGAVTEPWRPLVAFLFGTGARFGEATALTGGDFDLDALQPLVRISRAWKKGETGVYLGAPKSHKGVRTVTIDRGLAEMVRPLIEAAGRDGLVFTGRTGARVQSQHFYTRVWKPALERARLGKRPRVHDCRHSHVAALLARGITLPVIQRRLGHEDIRTTVNTYGHLAPDAHVGAADAAGDFLALALPAVEAVPQIEA